MEVAELAQVLERLGCPKNKSDIMARQLDRRARMDAERKGITYETALQHLVGLMAQGWAASSSSGSGGQKSG
jgi:hypothetical protein